MLPFAALLWPVIMMRTFNPWESAVTVARARFRRSVDELTKATKASPPPRPTKTRRPAAATATLAA